MMTSTTDTMLDGVIGIVLGDSVEVIVPEKGFREFVPKGLRESALRSGDPVQVRFKDASVVQIFRRAPPQKEKQSGTKHDLGKSATALLPTLALIKCGEIMDFGASKYDAHNWLKGLKYVRLCSAVLRHLFLWLGGQENDDESGLSHLAHAAVDVLMLLEFTVRGRKELDDRYVDPLNQEPKDE